MVLEEPSSSINNTSYDAFPTTDNFSQDSEVNVREEIDLRNFPRPLPILGAICGWGNKRLLETAQRNLEVASKVMQRRLTHDETMGFVHMTAKEVKTMSYAVPIGIAVSTWRLYSTRNTWKFPFYTMPKEFNPEEARLPGIGQVLKGNFARIFWLASRVMAYTSLGLFVTYSIAVPYASSVAIVSALTDPRLAAYREVMEKKRQQGETQQSAERRRRKDIYGQGSTDAGTLWKKGQEGISGDNTYGDNASPTGAQYPGSPPSDAFDQSPVVPSTDRSTISSQPFDSYDDASPTATYPSSSSSSNNSGSAWDRIRQSTQDPTSSPPRAERASGGRSSSTNQDRQPTRNETQKEFDDKLERERRGENFGASKGSSGDDGLW
ncbi:hypothetical protein MMC10_003763 [Thelotrema lepadinum]|nr:hypothetical protein [Thelotrema lepadinum]